MNTGHRCVTLPDVYDIGLLSNIVEEAFDLPVFEEKLVTFVIDLLKAPQFTLVIPKRNKKFLTIVFDTERINFFGDKVGMS